MKITKDYWSVRKLISTQGTCVSRQIFDRWLIASCILHVHVISVFLHMCCCRKNPDLRSFCISVIGSRSPLPWGTWITEEGRGEGVEHGGGVIVKREVRRRKRCEEITVRYLKEPHIPWFEMSLDINDKCLPFSVHGLCSSCPHSSDLLSQISLEMESVKGQVWMGVKLRSEQG